MRSVPLLFAVLLALALAPRTARAQCTASGTSMTLMNAFPGSSWDIHLDGEIGDGGGDAYDGGWRLLVDGVVFPAVPAGTFTTELGGRQLVHGPQTMSGLQVTRKVYVPTTERWARFVDFFTNAGAAPVTVTARTQTNLGADSGARVLGSSSGDAVFDLTDRWITTDDTDGSGDPSTSFNFWGLGGMVTPTAVSFSTAHSCFGTQGPSADFRITVPAGATVALMYFGGLNMNQADAQALTTTVEGLPMETLFGLSISEQSQIVNWRSICDATDRDGDGTTCLAGDCNDGDPMIRPGAMELCNGRDDNCAMGIDEGFTTGMACSAGIGFCMRSGTIRCNAAGTGTECSAMAGPPRMEVCNGIDDDCDGLNDLDEPGLAVPERCNGADDDCDLRVDETWPELRTACMVGVGFCTASGTVRCTADTSGTECSAMPGAPRMEVCNGIDDDCDGLGDLMEPGLAVPESCNGADDDCDLMIDEVWPTLRMPCTSGVGFCAAMGTERCSPDGTTTECSGMPGTPRMDVCNGIDDDCDGVADGDEMGLCDTSATGPVCLPVTPTASRCGCRADADCGAADSGMICDTTASRCVMGCAVGAGRNGCMVGRFCTVETEGMNGTCTATCNFDAQCAATMPDRPLCLRPTGGPGPTNRCVACNVDADCAAVDGRPICNAGDCVECTATRPEACATAEGGPVCLESGTCGCASDTDCPEGSFCHGTMRTCASLPDAGPPPVDAGPPGVDAGMEEEEDPARRDGGCGCEVPGTRGASTPWTLALAMLAGALVLVRLRRRR